MIPYSRASLWADPGARRHNIRKKAFVLIAAFVTVTAGLAYGLRPASAEHDLVDTIVTMDAHGRFGLLARIENRTPVDWFYFGDPGDQPLAGDWDCDGRDSVGVYRARTGEVFLADTTGAPSPMARFTYGNPGDIAVAGDFDGDGCDTVSVYRPSEGRFYIKNALTEGVADYTFAYGDPGDQPFVGDFDGDGRDTVAVRRSGSDLILLTDETMASVADRAIRFGDPGDRALAGDWDGDGVDTVALYRPSTGRIYLRDPDNGAAERSLYVGMGVQVTAVSGIDPEIVSGPELPPAPPEPPAPPGPPTPAPVPSVPEAVSEEPARPAADDQEPPPPGDEVPPPPGETPPPGEPPPADQEPPVWSDPVPDQVDIDLYPGDDVTAIVAAAPEGTVFAIHGRHVGVSIQPNDGQEFIGLDGGALVGDGAEFAFFGDAVDVTIRDLEITGYSPPAQFGAIHNETSGWRVIGNDIHHNATVGVLLQGENPEIVDNRIHHNGQLGIAVNFSTGGRVQGNEIAYNNDEVAYDWGWEAGGTKFWSTDGLYVADNWSHDNHGPGLWSDHDNIRIVYENNLVENNFANGIFHEIGYDAIIRNNTIRNNGAGHDVWLWGAGIVVAASQNVEIYGNQIVGNANGIALVQQDRGAGAYGAYLVRNNSVHDNTIVASGTTGVAQDVGNGRVFDDGNVFDANTYRGAVDWEWNDREVSWDEWRSFGNDTEGSYG